MNYKVLYEKHAKETRLRGYTSIISGAASIVTGFLLLRQLRKEQEPGT